VQRRRKAVFAPGDAREDWTILRALADALGVSSVGFDSFDALRAEMAPKCRRSGVEGLAELRLVAAQAARRRER
jgi:NADH-quinone oxidoreductase subunit G